LPVAVAQVMAAVAQVESSVVHRLTFQDQCRFQLVRVVLVLEFIKFDKLITDKQASLIQSLRQAVVVAPSIKGRHLEHLVVQAVVLLPTIRILRINRRELPAKDLVVECRVRAVTEDPAVAVALVALAKTAGQRHRRTMDVRAPTRGKIQHVVVTAAMEFSHQFLVQPSGTVVAAAVV
jgi:hypothetical protein